MAEDYLAHYGILGQKWGIRRYQNEDGTRTAAGRKRYSEGSETQRTGFSDAQKSAIKKGAIAVGAAATIAAAAYYVSKNPSAIKNAVKTATRRLSTANNADALKKIINSNEFDLGDIPKVSAGKKRIAKVLLKTLNARNAAKSAVGKGVKVATTAAITGASISATRKMLDSIVGAEESDRLLENYNAYNKKAKIAYKNLRKQYEQYEKYGLEEDEED